MRFSRLLLVMGLTLMCTAKAFASIAVDSIRVWPADDYTRVTMESKQKVSYKLMTLKNPQRLVLDLQNVSITPTLEGLTKQIQSTDPYIARVRIGQFKPDVVRLVFDLKTDIKPVVSVMKPVANYKWRLMLDIYPPGASESSHPADNEAAAADNQPKDLLMALAEKQADKPVATDAAKTHASRHADAGAQQDDNPAAAPQNDNQDSSDYAYEGKQGAHRAAHKVYIVAIDPGHGGEDPGAHGPHGTFEKNVTLAIGRKLKALIDSEPGMKAYMTRDGDYFVPLHTRVVKARNAHADLFVSIHADAYSYPEAKGSSVFALSEHGASSAMARYLAHQDNESDKIGGVSISNTHDRYLARTLLDLSQTATINASLKFGKLVLGNLGHLNELHHDIVEQAGFAVLKAPDIPSILVETDFITNPTEERRLTDDAYQEKLAKAILKGIREFMATQPARPLPHMVVGEN